jgi:hypothetical protein
VRRGTIRGASDAAIAERGDENRTQAEAAEHNIIIDQVQMSNKFLRRSYVCIYVMPLFTFT